VDKKDLNTDYNQKIPGQS